MSFAALLQDVTPTPRGLSLESAGAWRQGRTVYGGVTAALCLAAARTQVPERPLRSALIAFAGPSTGALTMKAETLREGRTASSVRTRLSSEAGIGVEAIFTFSGARESVLDHPGPAAPARAMPAPDEDSGRVPFPPGSPGFVHELDFVWAGGGAPFGGGERPYQLSWVRHRDPAAREHELGLIALADALAPAITACLEAPAPLSSMTWMIDFLVDRPRTRDGWWLLEARADHAAGGHSTQDMTIWNSEGECVAKGRQMVTVFA